jgi:hypothetical protein
MAGGPFKKSEDGTGKLIAYCGKYRGLEAEQLKHLLVLVEA